MATRLEEHRRTLEAADGFGPLLRLEELQPDEVALINAVFLRRCQVAGSDVDITKIYEAYVKTLHEWGVMCPHPPVHRLYNGWMKSDVPEPDCVWFTCILCNCMVINR